MVSYTRCLAGVTRGESLESGGNCMGEVNPQNGNEVLYSLAEPETFLSACVVEIVAGVGPSRALISPFKPKDLTTQRRARPHENKAGSSSRYTRRGTGTGNDNAGRFFQRLIKINQGVSESQALPLNPQGIPGR